MNHVEQINSNNLNENFYHTVSVANIPDILF